jgi:hypothetical protein
MGMKSPFYTQLFAAVQVYPNLVALFDQLLRT